MSVLVLWSGGYDSTVLVKLGLDAGSLGLALHFEYGQPAAPQEVRACANLAKSWDHRWQRQRVDMRCLDTMHTGPGRAGPRVLPGRNQILLSHAVNVAVAEGCTEVWFGAQQGDQEDYPDCRREFVDAMDALAQSWGVRVKAPLMAMARREIRELGESLGVPAALCWSCYQPRNGAPCGQCNSCRQD